MSSPIEVVVTGMGAVTSVGTGVAAFKQAALDGKSGIVPITEFDVSQHGARMGGMVRGFDPSSVLDAKQQRLAARIVQFAIGAAMEATGTDAEGGLGDVNRIATIIGTAMGGMDVLCEQAEVCSTKGPRRVSPFAVPQFMDNAAAAWIAQRWGLRGPAYSIASACSTSLDAVGVATDLIRSGRVDAALVGGAEAGITPFTLASFIATKMLSADNDHPEQACKPFDKHRDGTVMGEGAALLFVERRDRAEQRGAKILARVAGYGATQDAYGMVEARPDGEGLATAMRLALEQARVSPKDVGYVGAHAMGAVENDAAEALAIRLALGAEADRVPVGATKSMLGYCLGAAGALTAMTAVLAVNEGVLTPNVTFRTPDPRCNINVLAGKGIRQSTAYAMANSAGFGGHNSCVVFGAP